MPKISQFPAGGNAQNTDLIPIVRAGGDYTVTGYNLAALASYGQAYTGTFTATAGQTVFTLPASPGSLANLAISVDGAVMVPGTDYTWTSPVTLTFAVGLAAGQTVLYRYTTSVPIGTSLAGGTNGQLQYNNSGVLNGFTMSGDVTVVPTTGVATVNAPSSHITYTQGGTGATSRTVTSKLQESVSVLDFGADPTGATDSTTAIQNAINAAYGKTLRIPQGQYLISGSGLTASSLITIVGDTSSLNGTSQVSLIYSGTGNALSINGGSTKVFNAVVQNLAIKASGSAIASSTAVGLNLVNSNYGVFQNVVISGFTAGTAVLATASNSQIGASNQFIGCVLWNNFTGYQFDGISSSVADYASIVYGGTVIGTGATNSRGLVVTQYSQDLALYGVDFETQDINIDLYGNYPTSGGGVRLIGCRTEFNNSYQIRINANTNRTQIIGHRFVGGSLATWISDSGAQTIWVGADANVQINAGNLTLLNNIPLYAADNGGTQRQVLKMATNNTLQIGFTSGNGNFPLGRWNFGAAVQLVRTAPTYGTTVTIDASLGNSFDITATNGTGFTISSPTNSYDGEIINITILNTSGGALGTITWGGNYKMSTWTSPATGNNRSITFKFNGTYWYEVSRTAADVPN